MQQKWTTTRLEPPPIEQTGSDERVRENRLRRTAERRSLTLQKSRRRDPRAWDYGLYRLIEPRPPERGDDESGPLNASSSRGSGPFSLPLSSTLISPLPRLP